MDDVSVFHAAAVTAFHLSIAAARNCRSVRRKIEVQLASGSDVSSACRAVGISDATYYSWRKKFGSMGRSQLADLKFSAVKISF